MGVATKRDVSRRSYHFCRSCRKIQRRMIFYFLALITFASGYHTPLLRHPKGVGNTLSDERIVGGQDTELGEFPWQVSLRRTTNTHFCGGSLISEYHVMTAAHCNVDGAWVALGSNDYRYPAQSIAQKTFTPHPQFNIDTIDYDYSVITLAEKAIFGDNVGIITLAAQGVEYTGMATTSGWGYTTGSGVQVTPFLCQKATIPLVSQEDCQNTWGTAIEITDRMQCAGGDGTISSCQGDSGGPLTVQDNGETILIGAVSWVQSRCKPGYPAGYAKISTVRSWIDATVAAQT